MPVIGREYALRGSSDLAMYGAAVNEGARGLACPPSFVSFVGLRRWTHQLGSAVWNPHIRLFRQGTSGALRIDNRSSGCLRTTTASGAILDRLLACRRGHIRMLQTAVDWAKQRFFGDGVSYADIADGALRVRVREDTPVFLPFC